MLHEKELQDYQHLFNTDLQALLETPEDEVQYLDQNHFGDMLVEKVEDGNERFKLWRNLDQNECSLEIEHCGAFNQYTWETVFSTPLNIY